MGGLPCQVYPLMDMIPIYLHGIAAKITVLVCGLLLASGFALGLIPNCEYNAAPVSDRLNELKSEAVGFSTHFKIRVRILQSDTAFLAATAPVDGLIRAKHAGGVDPQTMLLFQAWHERMTACPHRSGSGNRGNVPPVFLILRVPK